MQPSDKVQPRSLSELFFGFSWLALQGFGGVLAVAQRELVERRRWLTREEFVEEWAVAQIMPGPNVINLAITLGARHFGLPGALASAAGMLTFPLVIVVLLGALYSQLAHLSAAAGALRGMAAVSAGLIIATGLKLMPALKTNVLGRPLCVALGLASFVGVAWLRLPLAWVLLGLGALAWAMAWKKLGP
jgi:chromate transporter